MADRDPFGHLEPGQDPLIHDEGVAKQLAKKAKDLPKTISGDNDDIYTNHKAGSLDEFTPKAERDPGPARRSGGGPVTSSPILDKLKSIFRKG